MTHEDFIRLAIEAATKGDAPYGALIVKDGKVLAQAYNTGKRDCDPSAHAEMNAIRSLTSKIQHSSLEKCILYTTAEPCPMCASACVWAGITEIIYGASIQDLMAVKQAQIDISCEEVVAKSFRQSRSQKAF